MSSNIYNKSLHTFPLCSSYIFRISKKFQSIVTVNNITMKTIFKKLLMMVYEGYYNKKIIKKIVYLDNSACALHSVHPVHCGAAASVTK